MSVEKQLTKGERFLDEWSCQNETKTVDVWVEEN